MRSNPCDRLSLHPSAAAVVPLLPIDPVALTLTPLSLEHSSSTGEAVTSTQWPQDLPLQNSDGWSLSRCSRSHSCLRFWLKTCLTSIETAGQYLLGQVAGDGDDLVFEANFVEGSAHAEPIHTLLFLGSTQRHKTWKHNKIPEPHVSQTEGTRCSKKNPQLRCWRSELTKEFWTFYLDPMKKIKVYWPGLATGNYLWLL